MPVDRESISYQLLKYFLRESGVSIVSREDFEREVQRVSDATELEPEEVRKGMTIAIKDLFSEMIENEDWFPEDFPDKFPE